MKTLNTNARVRVKLTPFAIEYYEKYYESKCTAEVDEYGFFETELWEIMRIFGQWLYDDKAERPFEGNVIYISDEDLETAQS